MREVKRFKPVINNKPYRPYAYYEENSEGIYVRIDDYEEIKAERDALAADNVVLKNFIGADFTNTSSPNIAFTDAILNSVRAEGVEMLAKLAGKEYQRFSGDKVTQRKWKSIVLLCCDFSNQLRAGIQIEGEE